MTSLYCWHLISHGNLDWKHRRVVQFLVSISFPLLNPRDFLLLIPIEGLSSGKVAVLAAARRSAVAPIGARNRSLGTAPGSVTILLGQEPHPGVCVRVVAPLVLVVWYPYVVILSPTSRRSASKTPPAADLDRRVDTGRYRCANIKPGKHGFLRLHFAINSLYRSG